MLESECDLGRYDNEYLTDLINSWTWGNSSGIVSKTQSQVLEMLTRNIERYSYFLLLTHYAKNDRYQEGIETLGGLVTSLFTSPHFRYGDRAIVDMQHYSGLCIDSTAYGPPRQGRLNVYLAPIPPGIEIGLVALLNKIRNRTTNHWPNESSMKIIFLQQVGSYDKPPYSAGKLIEIMGADNPLIFHNLIRTDKDVKRNLYWLSNKFRIGVI